MYFVDINFFGSLLENILAIKSEVADSSSSSWWNSDQKKTPAIRQGFDTTLIEKSSNEVDISQRD